MLPFFLDSQTKSPLILLQGSFAPRTKFRYSRGKGLWPGWRKTVKTKLNEEYVVLKPFTQLTYHQPQFYDDQRDPNLLGEAIETRLKAIGCITGMKFSWFNQLLQLNISQFNFFSNCWLSRWHFQTKDPLNSI